MVARKAGVREGLRTGTTMTLAAGLRTVKSKRMLQPRRWPWQRQRRWQRLQRGCFPSPPPRRQRRLRSSFQPVSASCVSVNAGLQLAKRTLLSHARRQWIHGCCFMHSFGWCMSPSRAQQLVSLGHPHFLQPNQPKEVLTLNTVHHTLGRQHACRCSSDGCTGGRGSRAGRGRGDNGAIACTHMACAESAGSRLNLPAYRSLHSSCDKSSWATHVKAHAAHILLHGKPSTRWGALLRSGGLLCGPAADAAAA